MSRRKQREQNRVWTPYSATKRMGELLDLAALGATPAQMREISEIGMLLHSPALGTA